MNVFAKFDEILSKILQDIKETNRYRRTHGRKDGQRENSIPSHKHSLQGYNEGARVLTRLYDFFSDTQGQLTPKSAAEFCPNWNSSKLLYLSSLPARMKKIQSNMKELEC